MEKLVIFSDVDNQRVRILTSKGLRADTLLEMSNARQREPQRADLNQHAKLPAIRHAPCSFTAWVRAASLAGNQSLYHDTMPLRYLAIENREVKVQLLSLYADKVHYLLQGYQSTRIIYLLNRPIGVLFKRSLKGQL